MKSSWFAEFQRDMRQGVAGALAGSVRGFGSASQWTHRNILSPASLPFVACYQQGSARFTRTTGTNEPGRGGDVFEPGLQGLLRSPPASARRADQGSVSQDGGNDDSMPNDVMMEEALQQCLMAMTDSNVSSSTAMNVPPVSEAIDRGTSVPTSSVLADAATAAAATAKHSRASSPAPGHAMASGIARAGRAVLGKRPAAPDKKDDDRGAHAEGASASDGGGDSAEPQMGRSAGHPGSSSLRRRGWPWSMSGPGEWADASGGMSAAPVRGVVQYLRRTVNQTGKLVVQTTGQLLRGGTMFQACRMQQVPGGGWVTEYTPGSRHQSDAVSTQEGGGAVGSELDMDAQAAHQLASDSSDSDPDLEATPASGDTELDQPALRSTISAVVAAVTTDSSSRAAEDEAHAAESMLRDASLSEDAQAGRHARMVSGHAASSSGSLSDDEGGSPTRHHAAGSKSGLGQAGVHDGSGVKRAEHIARRQMYPAGRVLHLMPSYVLQQPGPGSTSQTATAASSAGTYDAAVRLDDVMTDFDEDHTVSEGLMQHESSQGQHAEPGACDAPAINEYPRNAEDGGGTEDYVLLDIPDNQVYGRVRLCRAMVRDHFIPAYLRALDNVMGQLQGQAC